MALGTPENTKRNKQLFKLKSKYTFTELAQRFAITPTRAKQIYYRERERRKEG